MGTSRLPSPPPPPRTYKLPFYPPLLFPFLLFSFLPNPTTSTRISHSNYLTYYSKHCRDVVPESSVTGAHPDFSPNGVSPGEDKILHFEIAYLTGGQRILPSPEPTWGPTGTGGVHFSFHPKRNTFSLTRINNVLGFQATLRLFLPTPRQFNMTLKGRNFREIRFRPPRIPVRSASLLFDLYGFWSRGDGKLCMVGSGSGTPNLGGVSSYNVALKLNFPVKFSDFRSLINGVLESLDNGYFEPVSILGVPHFGEYKYTLASEGNGDVCLGGNGREENLHLDLSDPGSCLSQLYRYARFFELEYWRECIRSGGVGKCNPLGVESGGLPKFMTIQGVRCEHGQAIRVLIGFLSSKYFSTGILQRAFDPNTMLIGEGVWDEKKDSLCVVACRVLNFKDSLVSASIGDCSTRLSLRLPRTLTIRDRSTVVGQISSNKSGDDAGYFREVRFHGSWNKMRGLPGLRYKYTMLDRVSKSCPRKKTAKGRGRAYPNGYSSEMRFDMSVTNGKGQVINVGYLSPLFVNDRIHEPYRSNNNNYGLVNMSYSISFSQTANFKLSDKVLSDDSVEISAEGTYDNETGVLCMLGCRHLTTDVEKSRSNDSVDCEILISVRFSPLNANGNIKGTIKSMRTKSDSLYFDQLEISSNSIYERQAAKSIWRMDMEITMVLVSNTLACVFVGLQLYHVKKHPDVLPSISFVMLVILTLGYMIPLLLNFEALFIGRANRQTVLMGSDGWLEVNEVTVRVVTMIAFLLQFRLLQLAWSSRQSDGRLKSLWLSEKKVLYLSVPLYLGGALIAWYAHQWKSSSRIRRPYLHPHRLQYQQSQPWGYLKSYAGLVLDGFLLPQIFLNLFLNSKENILAPIFYVGTTIVRILPHAYDLFRAHTSPWYLNWSYIYANHRQDFYSTTWNIIIPIIGVVFVALLYLQQRFGGHCILPKRFRDASEYEKVPVVSSEEQQGEVTR